MTAPADLSLISASSSGRRLGRYLIDLVVWKLCQLTVPLLYQIPPFIITKRNYEDEND